MSTELASLRSYSPELIEKLNKDIEHYSVVHPIDESMKLTRKGVSRLVMLDRYAFKDTTRETVSVGDLVVLTVKDDPKFPARGIGYIVEIDKDSNKAVIEVEDEYRSNIEDQIEAATGRVTRTLESIDKPLEIFYEQIAKRNSTGLSEIEGEETRDQTSKDFNSILSSLELIPAGRVLYGAGSGTDVTYFNCYVMPFPEDSRDGIGEHRKRIMEIMSRGGGVGTNGSSLRPRDARAKGVNGKASGSVSWLDDIAKLTHLVEQGGSRRGAQMIMLTDWHPDIFEFIISKMQNPKILRFIIETSNNEDIVNLAKNKLKFEPLKGTERLALEHAKDSLSSKLKWTEANDSDTQTLDYIEDLLGDEGHYSVHDPEFLTGANISVCLTKEFMDAVENDTEYELRFPDVDNYNEEEMEFYDANWHEVGDVREWEEMGYGVKTYQTIKAKDLWDLINICATYSAEPGIFFIDNANDMTNATAYGQKVVATNPCGEQPLAPYSVCNLAALNLAEFVDKDSKKFKFDRLEEVVTTAIRMQDNVIDATPYFLEENRVQALGERRIGLGVMGLHDALIYCEKRYGSDEGNELVAEIFETIANAAYRASINLAKDRGSFPFLVGDSKEEEAQLRENFINTGFMKTMPEDIRQDILKYGIRNSHLLTVAPTGSTGTMAGVSTGLEPYFSFVYYRSGRLGKFIPVVSDIALEWLNNNGYEANEENVHELVDKLPEWFVTSMDLAPEEHVDVQTTIQRYVDSSLSKTVNAPKGYAVDQVQAVYERLHKGGAKGGTVYVDGSRDTQVLTLTNDEDNEVSSVPKKVPSREEAPVIKTNTINELGSTRVDVGNEVGDTCPMCREGVLEDIGGCSTCTRCSAQVKCGL